MPHDKPPSPTDDAEDALVLALANLRAERGGAPRDEVLGIFRRHLARIQAQVREEFETYRMAGVEAAGRLTALADGVVRTLFDHARSEIGTGGQLTDAIGIAATGGYGRSMLAPFSDIDLLFLAPDAPEPATLRVIEFMLYFMWDLGLKVGHATRSVAHCLADAEEDLTIRTSLLDARLVAGDTTLFGSFQTAFMLSQQEAGPSTFITAKQAERTERHRRFGESAFLVEPNIKEGRGGLRDLQTLYWMVRAAYGQFTPHALLDGPLDLLDGQERRAPAPVLGLPVDRAFPHALRLRPRRG